MGGGGAAFVVEVVGLINVRITVLKYGQDKNEIQKIPYLIKITKYNK